MEQTDFVTINFSCSTPLSPIFIEEKIGFHVSVGELYRLWCLGCSVHVVSTGLSLCTPGTC